MNEKQIEYGTKMFAPTPDSSNIVGKPFRFHIRLTQDDNPYYSYGDGKLTLSVDSQIRTAIGDSSKDHEYHTLKLTDVAIDRQRFIGQNGFGATARVTKVEREAAALAILSGPNWNASHFDEPGFDWEISLPPAQARAVALDTDLVIEGTFALLPTQKLVAFDFKIHKATLGWPSDITEHDAFVGAHITRIAFVRRSTGKVIKEWLVDTPA